MAAVDRQRTVMRAHGSRGPPTNSNAGYRSLYTNSLHLEHETSRSSVRIQRPIRPEQLGFRRRELAPAMQDLPFGAHALHVAADGAHEVHAEFGGRIGAPRGQGAC